MTIISRMAIGRYTKEVFKFEDGVMKQKFETLDKAAHESGVSSAGLSSYMNGKIKKPRKIPANVEYSYKSYLPKKA